MLTAISSPWCWEVNLSKLKTPVKIWLVKDAPQYTLHDQVMLGWLRFWAYVSQPAFGMLLKGNLRRCLVSAPPSPEPHTPVEDNKKNSRLEQKDTLKL